MLTSGPFDWTSDSLHNLDERGLRRARRTIEPLPGGRCRLRNSADPEAILWNFAGNDYLGLAEDSRVLAAAQSALSESGTGSRASALVTGRTIWHERLESRLAEFKQCEAALLFPTGYAANVGTICGLVGNDDVVLCDRLNHASLVDGCRLSGATLRVYPHNDLTIVERELRKAASARRRLIVTDSLFSMDGDAAPLADLACLAEEHNAMLLVDEAHATGLFGERGTGLLEAAGVKLPHVLAVGTLSKALGGQGGFVTGPQSVIDWLWNSARTQMFSTALTPAACAGAVTAIDIIEQEPQRRRWVLEQSAQLIAELRKQGWTIPENTCGPIIPLLIGEPGPTLELADQLQNQGCLTAAIRPPTVPHKTSRLRISLSWAHQEDGVNALRSALKRCQGR